MHQSQSLLDPQEKTKRPLDFPTDSSNPIKVAKSQSDDEHFENQETMNKKPVVQRYLVAVEYIGTRFSGSQKQPNCRTVVGVLEEAFLKFIGKPVSIFCSSRTDAGVHALSNVCHVDVERISKRKPGEVLTPHEPGVVRNAVNHFLQKTEGDIMLIDVRCVASDFHSRYRAQERTYFYRLLSGPEPLSIFEKERAWHIPEELNLDAMQKACSILVGAHDFSSFRSSGCQAKSPIKTLDELSVSEGIPSPYFSSIAERGQNSSFEQARTLYSETLDIEQPVRLKVSSASREKDGGSGDESCREFGQRRRHRCFVVTARARSFLYHQVRLLVGVLKAVGTADLTVNDVERILNEKNVAYAGPFIAPACGLYLGNVKYDLDQDFE